MSQTEVHPAESNGRFVAELNQDSFGTRVVHDIGGSIILMGLPKTAGWRPIPHELMLSHQVYTEKIKDWLANNPRAREVAIVSTESGTWKTVWLKDGEDPIADEKHN